MGYEALGPCGPEDNQAANGLYLWEFRKALELLGLPPTRNRIGATIH